MMNEYIVLYRNSNCLPCDPPFGFRCQAEDTDHAEEQCVDAEPDADIVWVVDTSNYQDALKNWWNAGEEDA